MFGRKKRERRIAILTALLDGPERGLTGVELCQAIERRPGTIHPDLASLEGAEWVTSYWEEPPRPDAPKDPETGAPLRCRYYKLTAHGRTRVLSALGRYNT